jgi:hypothetical protein
MRATWIDNKLKVISKILELNSILPELGAAVENFLQNNRIIKLPGIFRIKLLFPVFEPALANDGI